MAPPTPGPIMSAMNSYSRPIPRKTKTGHELPRRSSSAMLCTFFAARFDFRLAARPVGHRQTKRLSAPRSEPSPARIGGGVLSEGKPEAPATSHF